MTAFTLTVHDPDETYDHVPSSLMTLADWLERRRAGTITWEPDPYRGVGVRITDGKTQYFEETWGDVRSVANNLVAAAERLSAGRLALLRTAIDAPGAYIFLKPAADVTRVAMVLDTPPGGDAYPYRPNRHGASTQADTDALFVWAEAEADRLMAPSGNAALDRARGKLLVLNTAALIADLRANAKTAEDVSSELGIVQYA